MFNPFDRLIKRVKPRTILVLWNRGMGDIPLGLYAFVHRVRQFFPEAEMTFMTRSDLEEVFSMLDNVRIIVNKEWRRGEKGGVPPEIAATFDLVLEEVNPTKWFKWQLKKLTPRLKWEESWDVFADRFPLEKGIPYVGAHLSTETGGFYRYEKNWPLDKWKEVIRQSPYPVILFGHKKEGVIPGAIDLRGETTMIEMLAIIKNRCRMLLAPDSGILSVVYYVDAEFPLRVVSLWADPKQGVLRQGVASPNTRLQHIPLIGRKGDIAKIEVKEVMGALFS